MTSRMGHPVVLLAVMAIAFAVTALLLTRFIPQPHRPTDYLVIGSVSTFAALGVLGLVLVTRKKV